MGVPPYSTGNREQVNSEQSQFWTAHALPIVRAYADHFHSLDPRQPAAALLQSWQGGHLGSFAQEVVAPSCHQVNDRRLGLLSPLCHLTLPLPQGTLLIFLQDLLLGTFVTSLPNPQLGHSSPHSDFGSPRLTLTAMINGGRFSHVGHGVLLLRAGLSTGAVAVEESYPTPHIHEQNDCIYNGYDNINLEPNAMNNIDTVAHMNMHYTQY